MRILLTGVTSFTGAWFAKTLSQQGHDIVAITRSAQGRHDPLRAARLSQLPQNCRVLHDVAYGSSSFIDVINLYGPFDLFCHHGADTTNYKSPDFDALAAAQSSTFNVVSVLRALQRGGCRRVLLTGSVFEANEGAGTAPLRAFSPYGLSKTLAAEIFSYYAVREGFGLGKFVIPNPFGPLEEPRFCDYLMKSWAAGSAANVGTPAYVRDNIPVTLLALAYTRFALSIADHGFAKLNPGFYVESQGAFAQRFAHEIGTRLDAECALTFTKQVDFPEPRMRVNTDLLDPVALGWDEAEFWDLLADYYAARFSLARC